MVMHVMNLAYEKREKLGSFHKMASVIDFNHDEINVNDQVCVIDCTTFVPDGFLFYKHQTDKLEQLFPLMKDSF